MLFVACILIVCLTGGLASSKISEDELLSRLESLSRVKRGISEDAEAAEDGDYPFTVRLKGEVAYKFFWGLPYRWRNYYCGASILNRRWLVTAAHCFKQTGFVERTTWPKYWHARIGEVHSHDHWYDCLFNTDSCDLHLDKIVIHPDYNERATWANDIALVRVKEDMDFGDSDIGAVTLAGADTEIPANTDCRIHGWGCSYWGGPLEDILHTVNLPIFDATECQSLYGVSMDTRICAGRRLAELGICAGDSGGPLMCPVTGDDGSNSWVQAGIASFTSANQPESYPGAFTKVNQYLDWIQDETRLE